MKKKIHNFLSGISCITIGLLMIPACNSVTSSLSTTTDLAPNTNTITVAATTNIGMPMIVIAPNPVVSGDPFTIKGYDFYQGALILPGGITCSSVTFQGTATYDVNAGGFWLTIYQTAQTDTGVTTSGASLAPGAYTLAVTDDAGDTASTTFTVVAPSISASTTTSAVPVGTITTLLTAPQYTPSAAVKALLQESEVSFGESIPIPTDLPQGYVISDVQVIQQSDTGQKEVDLTITNSNAPDITLSLVWDAGGMFRILPTSEQYQSVNLTGGPGTYGHSAFLNYFSDHNTLWWDWTPVALSSQQLGSGSFPYYEFVLSASIGLSADELVLIAKSVQVR